MKVAIGKLRGMSAELEAKLLQHGIVRSDQLLEAARTPTGRKNLADSLGVEAGAVLELANRADLARVKGIAGVFSDLLENAGGDTTKELATRNSDNLYTKLVEVNAEQGVAGRNPTRTEVEAWIGHARELPAALEY